MIIPLLLLAWCGGRWSERIGCRPTEFRCSSGQCVDGGRYCDGNDDCFDASDEPDRCTNCNRTFFGEVGVKYPLRLSDRRSPTCTLSFVAAGGRHGDTVEITFLSFQIGTFDFDSSTCLRGYMAIEEEEPSEIRRRKRRRTKKKKKKGQLQQLPQGPPAFCGALVGPSASFYSSRGLRLTVVVPPAAAQPLVPRLYLTYRFLRRQAEDGGGCDQVLTDCDRTECVIRSPNFPGFYLRNISCHYWIRASSAGAQLEIFQDNEFKISIPNGGARGDKPGGGALTTDCAADALSVFDGGTADAPQLASFCGAGALPPLRSSGARLLLRLRSVPFQPPGAARFEIAVRVRRSGGGAGGCSVSVDGARRPSGVLRSPDYAVPAGTACTYRVTGARPTDRVWIYFASFHIPDADPWSEVERCDVSKMELLLHPKRRHAHHEGAETFCEKTAPRQCGHASDFPDLIPERPCTLPGESYLSSSSEIVLRMTYSSPTALLRGGPHFSARYEVVESLDACSFVVDSVRDGPQGVLHTPRNVFLFGRGGARYLRCRYELRGAVGERVRITAVDVRFPPICRTSFDPTIQRHTCETLHPDRFSLLNVTELWQGTQVFIGCACDDSHPKVVVESSGGAVDVEFSVRGMGPRDDFDTFRFTLEYEFVAQEAACDVTGAVRSGSKGGVVLAGAAAPLRCMWLLAALPGRALYVTVNGRTFDGECTNKILFYNINNREPYAVFCATDEDHRESFFTQGWRRPSDDPDLTLLEFLLNDATPAAPLEVGWVEVTLSSLPCPLECPELEACIGAELACDGVAHCPLSGSDEAPERCRSHAPFLAAIAAASCAVAAGILAVTVVVVRYRLRTGGAKTPVPATVGFGECRRTEKKKVPVVR